MSMPSSGSSTVRSASVTSSFVGMATRLQEANFFASFAGKEMGSVHEPHPVAARAHDERVRPRAVRAIAHAAQEIAVRDAGRGDDHLVRGQVVDREDPLDVLDPVFTGALDLAPG